MTCARATARATASAVKATAAVTATATATAIAINARSVTGTRRPGSPYVPGSFTGSNKYDPGGRVALSGRCRFFLDKTILHRNPHLIIEPIDREFFAVLNPLKKNSFKVINSVQHRILMSIDSRTPEAEIACGNGLSGTGLAPVIGQFLEAGLVNESGIFGLQVRGTSPGSLNLWVQTTNACNLRCGYCYIRTKDEHFQMDAGVRARLREKILGTVADLKLKRVSLRISGGEPFLVFGQWRDFLRGMQARLSEAGCRLQAVFLTNGTLMDEETAEIIKRERYRIAISMDGLRKFHDRARRYANGKGSYKNVIRTIDLLRKRGVAFSIMTVVSNDNLSHLADFTKFLVRRNVRFRYSIVDGVEIDYPKLSSAFRDCLAVMEKYIEKGYAFSKLFKLCDLKFGGGALRTCASGAAGRRDPGRAVAGQGHRPAPGPAGDRGERVRGLRPGRRPGQRHRLLRRRRRAGAAVLTLAAFGTAAGLAAPAAVTGLLAAAAALTLAHSAMTGGPRPSCSRSAGPGTTRRHWRRC